MEGLSAMLNREVGMGNLSPPNCKNWLAISHILYVDDVLLFVKANVREAENLKRILQNFASLFGLVLNPTKSYIFLGKSKDRVNIINVLGVNEGSLPNRYLGLPLLDSHITRSMCLLIVDKIEAKLDSWKI